MNLNPKPLLAALCAIAATVTSAHAATADAAGNRIEALQTVPAGGDAPPTQGCTADGRWCAEVVTNGDDSQDGGMLHVYSKTDPKIDLSIDFSPTESLGNSNISYAVWPHAIRLNGAVKGVLLGVLQQGSAGYSGGGASATQLQLFRIQPQGESTSEPVLDVTTDGSASIRACFSEADQRRRAGACSDEYEFTGTLALDPSVTSGAPRLVYTTHATSYPGHVSRNRDSLAGPPLHERDLVTVTNRRCSYRRVFTLNVKAAAYQPNAPLPDCSGYTVP